MKREMVGMLSVLALVLLLVLVGGCSGGDDEVVPRIVALQTAGDYRSAASGNWSTLAT